MPSQHQVKFRPSIPFPVGILAQAQKDLDHSQTSSLVWEYRDTA
jgi:hypothetical protein